MNLLNYKRITAVIVIMMLSVFTISAEGSIKVLATNSWTAAFVNAAGGSAEQLAPSSMEHPPEYELKPSDVKSVRDADLLVYAGYEVLMKTVFDSFGKPEDQLVQIATSYSPAAFEETVLAIAQKLGTVSKAKQNIAEYKHEIAEAKDKLKAAGLFGVPVLVQFHQQPLAETLGFDILAVFGPQPLEVRQLARLGQMKPALIIDNAHNPAASPIEEILGMDAVRLVNFPGFTNDDGSVTPDTLIEVMKYNVNRLITE